jgi:hypothetical protein
MNYLEWEGLVALGVAAIAPWIGPPLMLISAGLILIAFVHGIVSLVNRRLPQGIGLIACSILTTYIAYIGVCHNLSPSLR